MLHVQLMNVEEVRIKATRIPLVLLPEALAWARQAHEYRAKTGACTLLDCPFRVQSCVLEFSNVGQKDDSIKNCDSEKRDETDAC